MKGYIYFIFLIKDGNYFISLLCSHLYNMMNVFRTQFIRMNSVAALGTENNVNL